MMNDSQTELYSQNLKFLKEHATVKSYDAVANAVASNQTWRLTVKRDRNGNDQLRPHLGIDMGPPLHSARNPEDEAERQVQRWLDKNPVGPGRIVIVFGIAGGYHLRALAEHLDEANGILVIDANPGVVADAFKMVDFLLLLETGLKTLRFVIGSDSERLFSEFYSTLATWPRMDYSFLIHPGTQRAFSSVYDPLAHRLAERVRVDMLQRSTISNLTRGWLENSLRNLPQQMNSTPLQVFADRFCDIPAVVVAAGPTLEASLPLLRQIRDRVLIISVGTAYRPLLAAGISPHFTILVDGSPKIKQQFENVDTGVGRLMAPPQIYPDVVSLFANRLVTWQTGALPEFKDWFEAHLHAPVDSLGAGGTVTYSAIDAARYMGCPRIYTFGLDLAYADDGQTHTKKSMYDEVDIPEVRMTSVPGNVREQVQTTRQFASYIELLATLGASLLENPQCELVNVNPDGARIQNFPHCLPEELTVDSFPPLPPPNARERIDTLCRNQSLVAKSDMFSALIQTQHDLNDLAKEAQKATQLCRKLAKGGGFEHPKAEARLAQLQKAEGRLGEKTAGGLLLSAAVRASSMDTVAFCAGIDGSDEKAFVHVHEKCREYYAELASVIQWLRDELAAIRQRIDPANNEIADSTIKRKQ